MIPFDGLTSKIFGGVAVAALLFAGVQSWRLSGAVSDRDKARNAYAMELAKHSITRQSLDTLEGKLSDMIEAGKVTAANLEKSVAETKKETDAMRDEAGKLRSVVGEDCKTPAEILGADL